MNEGRERVSVQIVCGQPIKLPRPINRVVICGNAPHRGDRHAGRIDPAHMLTWSTRTGEMEVVRSSARARRSPAIGRKWIIGASLLAAVTLSALLYWGAARLLVSTTHAFREALSGDRAGAGWVLLALGLVALAAVGTWDRKSKR